MITLPNINLNGSSPKILTEDLREAMMRISIAISGVKKTEPHARDFPGRPVGFESAVKEHRRRLAALLVVHDELEDLHDAIEADAAKIPAFREGER